jgi:hypothetical protein
VSGLAKVTSASPFLAPSGVEYSFTFLSFPRTEKRISAGSGSGGDETGDDTQQGRQDLTNFFFRDVVREAGDVDAAVGLLPLRNLRANSLCPDTWRWSEGMREMGYRSLCER